MDSSYASMNGSLLFSLSLFSITLDTLWESICQSVLVKCHLDFFFDPKYLSRDCFNRGVLCAKLGPFNFIIISNIFMFYRVMVTNSFPLRRNRSMSFPMAAKE